MGYLDSYGRDRVAGIAGGSLLGIGGFVVWIALSPPATWAVVGIAMLFAGGVVAGAGSVGAKPGFLNAIVALGAIVLGEFLALLVNYTVFQGTSEGEGLLAAVVATMLLVGLAKTFLFTPFVLLGGFGGWARERIGGPEADEGPPVADRGVPEYGSDPSGGGDGPTAPGRSAADDPEPTGSQYRRVEDADGRSTGGEG